MNHKLANGMKMWKGIWNTTTLLFSLNGLKEYMIFLPRVKYFGIKIVPRSDLRARTAPGRTTSKKISFNIGTWNVRTLERAGKLKNLASEMDKCELNVVGLS